MNHRMCTCNRYLLILIPLMLVAAGCEINDYNADPDAEYRDSFYYTRSTGARTELFINNVNGEVTIIGVDTLSNIVISGSKIVRDQTVDDAMRHIGDIEIVIVESGSLLSVKTLQPNTSYRRTYQVNYEVMVPSSWKVTATNVNGNVGITNIHNTASTTTVNGSVNVSEISGSISVNVTNGTVSGKVVLPENEICNFSAVNGNVTLLVPRTTSASVSATVTNGSVSVSNFPIVYGTNSRTNVTGTSGAGKGTIRLSSVNGIIQLIGF